jgi:hypothetical protein
VADSAPAPLLAIRRRNHWLVYSPQSKDAAGFSALENRLSVRESEPTGASWVTYKAMLYDMDPQRRRVLRLPGALSPDEISSAFPAHKLVDDDRVWVARKVRVKFKTKDFPYKNDDQRRVHDYLSCVGDYAGQNPGARLVVAGTAAGKSYAAIRSWVDSSDVLLGTFAASAHLENFRVELLKFTDLTEDEILVIDDGRESIRKAYKKGTVATAKVCLVLHRTVASCASSVVTGEIMSGVSEFVKLVQDLGVGTHVSDECHLELASLITLAMMINVERTFYLTATAKRSEWMEDRVYGAQMPRDWALVIASPARLIVRQIKYNSNPTEKEVAKSVNRRKFFDPVYFFDRIALVDQWEAWAEMATALVGRALAAPDCNSVGIVVSGRLEFLDATVKLMRATFPERSVGNFSSRVKAGELRDVELHKDIVVTTEKSFNGSVNPIRMTHLLLFAPISSAVWVEQVSGRLRGVDGAPCYLWDIWDAGFPKIESSRKERRKLFKKISLELEETDYVK